MYLANFKEISDIASQFSIEISELENCRILFAAYTQESYEGSALVIFTKGDKLYEVNGSHCSCMGLEGQWQPEETTFEAIRIRDLGGYGFNGNAEALLVDLIFEKEVLE